MTINFLITWHVNGEDAHEDHEITQKLKEIQHLQ